jgi:hypothetical protein
MENWSEVTGTIVQVRPARVMCTRHSAPLVGWPARATMTDAPVLLSSSCWVVAASHLRLEMLSHKNCSAADRVHSKPPPSAPPRERARTPASIPGTAIIILGWTGRPLADKPTDKPTAHNLHRLPGLEPAARPQGSSPGSGPAPHRAHAPDAGPRCDQAGTAADGWAAAGPRLPPGQGSTWRAAPAAPCRAITPHPRGWPPRQRERCPAQPSPGRTAGRGGARLLDRIQPLRRRRRRASWRP